MPIFTRAKMIRMARGETLADASAALGVDRRTVYSLENGKLKLDSMRLGFVAKAETYYGEPITALVQTVVA